eukprot:g6146.t1
MTQSPHRASPWTGGGSSRVFSRFIISSVSEERRLMVQDIDPELWKVLEICDIEELQMIHRILFSRNPFSPFVKNLITETDQIDVQFDARDSVMYKIQNQFQFLAASSLETIRGVRPSYRDTLLHIRSKFGVKCKSGLETQDLESEIYLFLLENCEEFLTQRMGPSDAENVFENGDGTSSNSTTSDGFEFFQRIFSPLKLGRDETISMISKFTSAITVSAIRKNLLRNLGGQIVSKQLRYQLALRAAYAQGKRSLQKTIAVQVAQKNVSSAVARYSTVKGALSFLGPLLWAWFVADVALKSIGTDYARIVNVVFSLAQVRLVKTHGFTSPYEDSSSSTPDETNEF